MSASGTVGSEATAQARASQADLSGTAERSDRSCSFSGVICQVIGLSSIWVALALESPLWRVGTANGNTRRAKTIAPSARRLVDRLTGDATGPARRRAVDPADSHEIRETSLPIQSASGG